MGAECATPRGTAASRRSARAAERGPGTAVWRTMERGMTVGEKARTGPKGAYHGVSAAAVGGPVNCSFPEISECPGGRMRAFHGPAGRCPTGVPMAASNRGEAGSLKPGRGSIEVAGLSRRFAEHLALDGISLEVRDGEFFS